MWSLIRTDWVRVTDQRLVQVIELQTAMATDIERRGMFWSIPTIAIARQNRKKEKVPSSNFIHPCRLAMKNVSSSTCVCPANPQINIGLYYIYTVLFNNK